MRISIEEILKQLYHEREKLDAFIVMLEEAVNSKKELADLKDTLVEYTERDRRLLEKVVEEDIDEPKVKERPVILEGYIGRRFGRRILNSITKELEWEEEIK